MLYHGKTKYDTVIVHVNQNKDQYKCEQVQVCLDMLFYFQLNNKTVYIYIYIKGNDEQYEEYIMTSKMYFNDTLYILLDTCVNI